MNCDQHRQGTGNRDQATGNREQAGNREQGAASSSQQQAAAAKTLKNNIKDPVKDIKRFFKGIKMSHTFRMATLFDYWIKQ